MRMLRKSKFFYIYTYLLQIFVIQAVHPRSTFLLCIENMSVHQCREMMRKRWLGKRELFFPILCSSFTNINQLTDDDTKYSSLHL